MAEAKHVIEIENITKSYRVKGKDHTFRKGVKAFFDHSQREYIKALDDVSLKVRKGEILGILGPNGAGKTTLIKVIAGILIPENGKSTVCGQDAVKERKDVRTSVSLLRSGGWVIFDYKLSLYQNLKFWGVLHDGIPLKDIDNKVHVALDLVGLGEKINEPPENLSAGMRQKLALALTLMSDRPIYLMDEPTSNIDPQSADFLRKTFRERLIKEGKTIVLATHNLWEAEDICDRILILDKGKVLVMDTTENIKRMVGEEVMEVKMDSVSQGLIDELNSIQYVNRTSVEGSTVKLFGSTMANAKDLLEVCSRHGKVLSTKISEASMNEVFLQLVGRDDQ
jgi:ABC-2 type transport system ATP-binding protein